LEGRWRLDGEIVATALRLAIGSDDEAETSRTPSERRAEALVDICRVFLEAREHPPSSRHRPHANVIVTAEDLEAGRGGECVDGVVLDGPLLASLVCDSVLHRVMMAGSVVLDYGTATRVVSANLFNTLVVRDRHCRFPGCDRPPMWTDAHVVHVEDGGPPRSKTSHFVKTPSRRPVRAGGINGHYQRLGGFDSTGFVEYEALAEALGVPERSTQPHDGVVPFRDAVRAWFRISLQTFGGPAGQIAVMHRELVDERRWFGERRFLHALNYCMLLPGPEAQQLAIYLGWLLNGTAGGLVAGALFVLPGFLAILALSTIYVGFGDTDAVTAVFAGVGPAVLVIVASALWRVAGRALSNPILVVLAVVAFVALFAFGVPFPAVIAAAAIGGFVGGRRRPGWFSGGSHGSEDPNVPPPLVADDALHGAQPSLARAARVLLIGAVAWGTPLALLAVLAPGGVYLEEGLFFSGTAVVTFGGAYAVLSYIAQRAVEVYGWLAPGEMVRGLAMAETTPGPLIQVVQFVGFMGAYRNPGSLEPWVAGLLASVLVTWVTYVPCFLWIFLGAPYIEALRENRGISDALAGITAAVVGVIANLAIYFAVHTIFTEVRADRTLGPLTLDAPVWSSTSPRAVVIAAIAFILLFRWKWSVLRVLGACALLGIAAEVAFG
jgi:chromate transporter